MSNENAIVTALSPALGVRLQTDGSLPFMTKKAGRCWNWSGTITLSALLQVLCVFVFSFFLALLIGMQGTSYVVVLLYMYLYRFT